MGVSLMNSLRVFLTQSSQKIGVVSSAGVISLLGHQYQGATISPVGIYHVPRRTVTR